MSSEHGDGSRADGSGEGPLEEERLEGRREEDVVEELRVLRMQHGELRKKYRHLEEEMQVLEHASMAQDASAEKRGSRKEEALKQQLAHVKEEHEAQFSHVMDLEFKTEVLDARVKELEAAAEALKAEAEAARVRAEAAEAAEAAAVEAAGAAAAERAEVVGALESQVAAAEAALAAAAAAAAETESRSEAGEDDDEDVAGDYAKLKKMFKALKVQFIKKKKKLIQVLELHKQLKHEFAKKRDQNAKLKQMFIANREKLKTLAAKHLALKKAYRSAVGADGAPSESTTDADASAIGGPSTELVHKLKQRVIALKQKVKSLDVQKRKLQRRVAELSAANDASPTSGGDVSTQELHTSRMLKEKLLKQQSIRRRLERDVEMLKGSPGSASAGPRTLAAHKLRLAAGGARSTTLGTADMLAVSRLARSPPPVAPSSSLGPSSPQHPVAPSIADRRLQQVKRGRRNSISMM